jgi:alcohol dehydrogenase (NADP+)
MSSADVLDTYNDIYMLDEGHSDKPMKDNHGREIFSQGGFSSHSRVHEQFVFPIPDNIPSHEAAPMMCAGLTAYSPLVRAGCSPGKKVAIVGIGALGHFGLIWAKALGAEVWALSHAPSKQAEAMKLGASHFINTMGKNWATPLAFTFDFMLNTAGMINESNAKDYMSTLAVNGTLHTVGLPDTSLPQFMVQDFASNGSKLGGSHVGSKKEALAMLKLASENNIHPMVETIDISQAGCVRATQMIKTKMYSVTLVNFNIFGLASWVI